MGMFSLCSNVESTTRLCQRTDLVSRFTRGSVACWVAWCREMWSTSRHSFQNASLWPHLFVHKALQFWPMIYRGNHIHYISLWLLFSFIMHLMISICSYPLNVLDLHQCGRNVVPCHWWLRIVSFDSVALILVMKTWVHHQWLHKSNGAYGKGHQYSTYTVCMPHTIDLDDSDIFWCFDHRRQTGLHRINSRRISDLRDSGLHQPRKRVKFDQRYLSEKVAFSF